MKSWVLRAVIGCLVVHPLVVLGEETPDLLPTVPAVEIEQPLHFPGPQDTDIVVQPGFYEVTAGEEQIVLTPDDDTAPLVLQAQSTKHEEDLTESYALLEPGEEDVQHLLLLLPGEKAWEATGSVSGTQSRAIRRARKFSGFKLQRTIVPPVIKGVFTTPQLLTLTPNGTLHIKGRNFGSRKGKVLTYFPIPDRKKVWATIEKWSDTAIKVTVPGLRHLYGVADQRAGVYVRTARNTQSRQQPILFKQKRWTKKLPFNDPAITRTCSSGGDNNWCDPHNPILNPWKVPDSLGRYGPEPFSLFGYHKNTDSIVDVDDGTDKFGIVLRNGWVFKKFEAKQKLRDDNGWINMPSAASLNQKLKGGSVLSIGVGWKLSPGISELAYGYHVEIEGPVGIPYVCSAGKSTCRCEAPHRLWNEKDYPDPFSRMCFKHYCTPIGDRQPPEICKR